MKHLTDKEGEVRELKKDDFKRMRTISNFETIKAIVDADKRKTHKAKSADELFEAFDNE